MFLKTDKKNGKTYISIVESYWENGRSKQKCHASLGCLERFDKTVLKTIGEKIIELAGFENDKKSGLLDLEEINRLNWGAVQIFSCIWQLFELDKIIRDSSCKHKIKFDPVSSIFNIVVSRLVHPSSKLQVYLNQSHYLGLKDVPLHHLYRCLDLLSEAKDDIEKHLFDKNRNLFNMSVDIVFYDVTTLYFESVRKDTLKNFGYSKDCKFGEVQVVVGLIVDMEGRPIGFEVFPGNTFEGHSLISILQKLRQRFQIKKVIIVADRGINAKLNLKAIKDEGYDYIVGSRIKSLPKDMQNKVLDLSSYQSVEKEGETITFAIKEFEYENIIKIKNEKTNKYDKHSLQEKLVCSWSAKRAKKDKADRERLIAKAKDLLEDPGKIENKRGAKKYIKGKSSSEFDLDTNRIEQDEKWDGFYGIQCSEHQLSTSDILDAYKNLWRIEEAFRVLKSNLETRPIYHWTEKRIRGHLVTCFIAFLLERSLEIELRKNNVEFSPDKIREAISKLEVTLMKSENEYYYLRSKINPLEKEILRILKIKIPNSLTGQKEFHDQYSV